MTPLNFIYKNIPTLHLQISSRGKFYSDLKTPFILELHLEDKTNLANFFLQVALCKNLLHLKCTSKRYLTLAQQLTWTVHFNRDVQCDKYYYDLSPHSFSSHFFLPLWIKLKFKFVYSIIYATISEINTLLRGMHRI